MTDMLLKNSARWVETGVKMRSIKTFLIVAVCFLFRSVADDYLEHYLPTEVFLFGSLVVAFLYGYVPALASLIGGWLIGLYYFVEPYGQFAPVSKLDLALTANSFITGLAGIATLEFLQRTRYSMRLMLKVSESRYRSLLKLDNHRVHHQRQSTRALRQISDIFSHLDRVLVLFDHERRSWLQPLFMEMVKSPLQVPAPAHWLSLVHADDRPRVEKDLSIVLDGLREFRHIRFRIAIGGDRFEELDCVCRSLTLSAHRHVFALVLKAPEPQSVQP
jgi:K+-sensing histidine kinase KdpD